MDQLRWRWHRCDVELHTRLMPLHQMTLATVCRQMSCGFVQLTVNMSMFVLSASRWWCIACHCDIHVKHAMPAACVGRLVVHSVCGYFDLYLWLQNLISTSVNPNTSVTKIGWSSLSWILRYGVHRWTDTNTECFWHRVPTAVEAQICILTSCIPLFNQLDMMCHIELCSSFSYTPTLQEIYTSLESLAHLQ